MEWKLEEFESRKNEILSLCTSIEDLQADVVNSMKQYYLPQYLEVVNRNFTSFFKGYDISEDYKMYDFIHTTLATKRGSPEVKFCFCNTYKPDKNKDYCNPFYNVIFDLQGDYRDVVKEFAFDIPNQDIKCMKKIRQSKNCINYSVNNLSYTNINKIVVLEHFEKIINHLLHTRRCLSALSYVLYDNRIIGIPVKIIDNYGNPIPSFVELIKRRRKVERIQRLMDFISSNT